MIDQVMRDLLERAPSARGQGFLAQITPGSAQSRLSRTTRPGDRWLGSRQPFTLAFAAIAVAAWFAGWRAGLLTVVMCHLCANYFFIAPRHTFSWNSEELAGAGSYYLIAGVIVFLGHSATRANRSLGGMVTPAAPGRRPQDGVPGGGEEDRGRTRSAGFDHHLTKPASLEALDEVLQIDSINSNPQDLAAEPPAN